MQLIQSTLDDLTDTLSNGIIQIRLDTLNQPRAQIQAHYKTVADIIDTACDIADRNLTEAEHERQMSRLQRRLDDRLQACANIPEWLGWKSLLLCQTSGTCCYILNSPFFGVNRKQMLRH